MTNSAFFYHLETELSRLFNNDIEIVEHRPVSGGSINEAYQLITNTNKYFFIKCNSEMPLHFFDVEEEGLNALRKSPFIEVPKVYLKGQYKGTAYLVMEFMHPQKKSPDYWEFFGRGLAQIHKNSNTHFGFHQSNYMGAIPQPNNHHQNFIDFFREERLLAQVNYARSHQGFPSHIEKDLLTLCNKLEELIPHESPALLHGDLWAGNLIEATNGNPCLIDPAVYYGHREIDLAMTQLFGGFDPVFFQYYEEEFPLKPGFQERKDLYNLYPLLIHFNLFGESYLNQVQQILKRYV